MRLGTRNARGNERIRKQGSEWRSIKKKKERRVKDWKTKKMNTNTNNSDSHLKKPRRRRFPSLLYVKLHYSLWYHNIFFQFISSSSSVLLPQATCAHSRRKHWKGLPLSRTPRAGAHVLARLHPTTAPPKSVRRRPRAALPSECLPAGWMLIVFVFVFLNREGGRW